MIEPVVTHYRKLAETNPDAFLPNLAMAYGSWGRIVQEDQPSVAAEKFADGYAGARLRGGVRYRLERNLMPV
jgi:hypothetical protein